MSDATALRIVMVTADIEGDIEQGLDLANEPTVILQGPVVAVREAARMFGEAVKVSPSDAPDPALFAEVVEALRDLLNAVFAEDRHRDRALTITGPTANLKQLLEAQDDALAILAKIGGAK